MTVWNKVALILLAVAVAAAIMVTCMSEKENDKKTNQEQNIVSEKEETESRDEVLQRVAREGIRYTGGDPAPSIVLDPVHGGYDPGKIGVRNSLEKNVNLSVALRIRDYLEAAGIRVVMTREKDESLGGEGGENRKVRDLKERIRCIDEEKPAAAVSIHQNSFPQEDIRGAQVFYYTSSLKGKQLAQLLQNRLVKEADPENKRVAKDNNTYYLLKKTSAVLVIAECGFLSNPQEEELLTTREYQDRIAWAIYLGIMDFLAESK